MSLIARCAVISDEISKDIATAAELAVRAGLRRLELRNLRTGRFPRIVEDEAFEVRRVLSASALAVRTVSPGLCKQPIAPGVDFDQLASENWRLLEDTVTAARDLGAEAIIAFGFRRPKEGPVFPRLPDEHLRLLIALAAAARDEGFELLLENHSSCHVATTDDLLTALDEGRAEGLGLNWDPYNSWVRGRGVEADDLRRMGPALRQIHVKDGRATPAGVVRTAVGDGDLQWGVVLAAPEASGPLLVLEPHRRPRVAAFETDMAAMRALLDAQELAA